MIEFDKMTECERIIEQGVLPESFFKEEMICDFLVTEKRKKLWSIGIDLLFAFDRICRKHNLKYFLSFGSLLGAVRHHGFIPWDDDIDVCMPRQDYEVLFSLANEFSEPYFLQFPGTDKGYYFSYAKLRNSNTSAIAIPFCFEQFNQGIGLDIFPIDNCVQEYAESNWKIINDLILWNSTNMRRSLPFPTKNDLDRMMKYPIRNGEDVLEELNKVATQYNNQQTECGIVSTVTAYKANRQIYRWSDILDTMDYGYYGHLIKIPRNYDEILKITYGDYMQLPSKEQRGTWHVNASFEPDIPYHQYVIRVREAMSKKNNPEVL